LSKVSGIQQPARFQAGNALDQDRFAIAPRGVPPVVVRACGPAGVLHRACAVATGVVLTTSKNLGHATAQAAAGFFNLVQCHRTDAEAITRQCAVLFAAECA
jgi:hypothetical protein